MEYYKDKKSIDMIATDDWRSYHSILPSHKHIQSKAETYTVEGYNTISFFKITI